ncbi:phosphotransferase family protein [Nocardia farcinica]|uniref:phosphotransferase family protein n=1 Tax=Nocardia farcinica TaxID=37329 RepID=UPI00245512EE|nr:phosphotransferase [Nocardia farcinica]
MDTSATVTLPDDWEPRLRAALLATPVAAATAGRLRVLGAGLDSVALLLEHDGERYVLRCPKGTDGAAGIARESRVLPELAPTLALPIPQFVCTAPNPLGPGEFCIYPAVPGESLTEDQWVARGLAESDAAAGQVARFLDQLHAFPVDRARQLGVENRDMRDEFTDYLTEADSAVLPRLAPPDAATLRAAWTAYLADDANFAYTPTLIHADVSPDHLLVTGQQVTGVIDFGDLQIADPDYDLLYLWTDAGPDFVERVQHHRGRTVDARLRAKLRFWTYADSVIDILHALEHDLPDLLDESMDYLVEALRA